MREREAMRERGDERERERGYDELDMMTGRKRKRMGGRERV